jgi:GNAT superfamily N-acetyltransferase
MNTTPRLATTDAEIDATFEVMQQLRPHLQRTEFVARVRRQAERGYRLAFVEDSGRVVAVAGFRLVQMLAWGEALYVDDLVTDAACRSSGQGQRLFDWLVAFAREHGCDELHLDSGVQRFDAHRFYLRNRMKIASHHFSLRLREPSR